MRIPLPVALAVTFLLSSGFGLFHIKFQVQNLKKDIAEIKKQIAQEKNEINVLSAEWAFLNKPERLRNIASKYFPNLAPITVAQLGFKKEPTELEELFAGTIENNSPIKSKEVIKASFKAQRSNKDE